MDFKPIDPDRPLKLFIHTYSLHFWGIGSSWGTEENVYPREMSLEQLMDYAVEWELDGLHLNPNDLETKDPVALAEIRDEAKKRGLEIDLNVSFDDIDKRLNVTPQQAIDMARVLNANIIKWCLDIHRPRILYGSRFDPTIMTQLIHRYDQISEVLPQLEEYGIKMALENHADTFSDEVLWLVKKLNHPMIGACIDTTNPAYVGEEFEVAVENMLPYSIYTHFSDDLICCDETGVHCIGGAHGQGSINLPLVLKRIREVSPMDRVTFENEIFLKTYDEPIEVARERELELCIESARYCREELGLGVRNR